MLSLEPGTIDNTETKNVGLWSILCQRCENPHKKRVHTDQLVKL